MDPEPIDAVYTFPEAIRAIIAKPHRVTINLADGQPPLRGLWEPRMKLRGATLYVHRRNEAVAMAWLNRS